MDSIEKVLDPIIKTRYELYVPFVATANHEDVMKNLIEISSEIFGGSTLLQHCKGYYKDPEADEIVLDMVDIFIIDVDDPRHDTMKDLNALSNHIKNYLNQQVVYYAYYKVMATDVRGLQNQPGYRKYLEDNNINTF